MSVNRIAITLRRLRLQFVALLAFACLLNFGCASTVGSRSTWELWNMTGSQGAFGQLERTVDLLEGSNDFSDVAQCAELFMQGPTGGFRVIAEDLQEIFSSPFSFEELHSTFRLLR